MSEDIKPKPKKMSIDSWYSVTPNRLLATLGPLKGEINCDVCVIGGGFTGISAALELSKQGFSVVLLEKTKIGSGSSGKNGGHLIRGFNHGPSSLASKFDPAMAKTICNMTLEGLDLIVDRIKQHGIDCDLKFGHVTAAMNESHADTLKRDIAEWATIGHDDLKYMGEDETKQYVNGKGYIGGLYDPKGAHFHPINYLLGIAQAAQTAGCRIYEETHVHGIEHGEPAKVLTRWGSVTAKFLVIGGHIYCDGMQKLHTKVITATANMIATEPLSAELAHSVLPKPIAATDANFIMNYYRLSADNRMLFGGDCNYSAVDYPGRALTLKKRMTDVFPQLAKTRIDHCWGGALDLTINRMPDFGRLAPNVFYAQGYGGHGIILSNLAGKLLAEAVSGTAERFDIFGKIKHAPFIGGDLLKRPLFVLGMMWYRLRDAI